jgi:predicted XRE-type DNA-binding protein
MSKKAFDKIAGGLNDALEVVRGQRFASVWDAIEDTPAQAENMRLRSDLMMALKSYIEREKLNQTQAAKVLGVTQPRVSDLTRGRINLFSLDMLVTMAVAAGLHVEMKVLEDA